MNEITARSGNRELVSASAGLPACLHFENGGTRTADRHRVKAWCHPARNTSYFEADAACETSQRRDRDRVGPGASSRDRQGRRSRRNTEVSRRVDRQRHRNAVTQRAC